LGVGSAQAPLTWFDVTFYEGDPANGGEVLVQTQMNNLPVATRLDEDDLEGTTHLTVAREGERVTFEVFPGGASKYAIYLDQGEADRDDAMTLAELLEGWAADPSFVEALAG